MRQLLFSALSIISLGACSLYQSDARKFLEKQAFEYAGKSASAYLTGCDEELLGEEWLMVSRTDSARIYASEIEEFTMKVKLQGGTFSCAFRFNSAQEMIEQTPAAIDLTVLHQSLGEFAFPSVTLVK